MRGFGNVMSARLGTAANLASSASTGASSTFGAQTYQVRVVATAAVNVKIGDGTPTAAATDTLLTANIPEYFTCTPGQKLASIGTATVNITEITQ